MLDKFNELCNQILTEAKKPVKRRVIRIKNMPTKKNLDQFCQGKTKEIKTPLTQTKNVK